MTFSAPSGAQFATPGINLSNFVRELPRFFKESDAFAAELIQNAYRAGATKIKIFLEPSSFKISDNGHGIKDFNDILVLAQSGWQNDRVYQMDPAGMGIFSAYFAAKNTDIISWRTDESGRKLGQRIMLDQTKILRFEPVTVSPCPATILPDTPGGTIVNLDGMALDVDKIHKKIESDWKYLDKSIGGSEITITVNSKEIEKKDFFEDLPNRFKISAGELALPECTYSDLTRHYHQFSCAALFGGTVIPLSGDIIGCKFRLKVSDGGLTPRLPDRSSFVEDSKFRTFEKELYECWRKLAMQLDEMSYEMFKELYPGGESKMIPLKIESADLYENMDLPSSRSGGGPTATVAMAGQKSLAELKQFDYLISSDYDSSNERETATVAALLNSGLNIGIVGDTHSRHPEFLKRFRKPADFHLKYRIKPGKSYNLKDFTIADAIVSLKDPVSGRTHEIIRGVVPLSDNNSYMGSGETYLWCDPVGLKEVANHHEISGRIKDAAALFHSINTQEDQREDPFDDDFNNAIYPVLRRYFDTQEHLIQDIYNIVRESLNTAYPNGYLTGDPSKTRINLEWNKKKELFVSLKTEDAVYVFKNKKWDVPKSLKKEKPQ